MLGNLSRLADVVISFLQDNLHHQPTSVTSLALRAVSLIPGRLLSIRYIALALGTSLSKTASLAARQPGTANCHLPLG